MKWREWLGLGRSLAIYYGIPTRLPRMKRFYGQFIKPGDLCFDIGAHVGNRVHTWQALGARVIAVEPNPRLVRWLNRWVVKDQTTVVEAGVGAQPGRAPLYISSRTPTVSSFSSTWMNEVQMDPRFQNIVWDQTESVTVTTLDQLIERHGIPVFCKLDVEGWEAEALTGLTTPLPAVSFEFITAASERAIACIDQLQSLGDYRFGWSFTETMRFANQNLVSASEMIRTLQQLPLSSPSGDIYAFRS